MLQPRDHAVHLAKAFASLPDDRAERWRRVASFVREWHGGLAPADGVSERRIKRTEERLGIRLPAALREFYQQFGWKQEITIAFDMLVPIRRLERRRDLLVFWFHDVH